MTLFNVPQPWGYHYYYFFFSSCQNVNFNEKYLQTGLPLGGMSLQAKSGLDESECSWVCFLMRTGVWATQTYTCSYPCRLECFATYTIESQRCTHFFSSIHIPPVCLIPASHLALSFYRGPTCLFSCTFVPVFSTQILKIVCVSEGSVSLSHSSTLSTPSPIHTGLLFTDTPGPLHSIPHHLLFLTAPSISVSNLHKRHFRFRLVLKGNVSADSQASEPLGSLNHLQQILWLSPLEYCGGRWDNSGLLLNGALMGGFDPRSKLVLWIQGSRLLEDDNILSKRARATVFIPNETLGWGLENCIFNKFPESCCAAGLKIIEREEREVRVILLYHLGQIILLWTSAFLAVI